MIILSYLLRRVARFREHVHNAFVRASALSSKSDTSAQINMFAELPFAPHWNLGFSGPTGIDISKSLSDWSASVLELSKGWTLNYMFAAVKRTQSRKNIGFLSSWFCNSAVGRLMIGLVRELDRSKFRVCLFHIRLLSGKVFLKCH